ncbi:uncharacterized protein LOC110009954 [Jatropha curcas]|uniref:uncharacterized protein LOC110009954 n=1 Tax=Jatropha curcas TaxID=180498 RepID=UPI0009D66B88|nr:uncharacterized protein LOC110009954 [Jatropha curcas]
MAKTLLKYDAHSDSWVLNTLKDTKSNPVSSTLQHSNSKPRLNSSPSLKIPSEPSISTLAMVPSTKQPSSSKIWKFLTRYFTCLSPINSQNSKEIYYGNSRSKSVHSVRSSPQFYSGVNAEDDEKIKAVIHYCKNNSRRMVTKD